jgi:hypothetical protein
MDWPDLDLVSERLIANALAHLVTWSLPVDHPDYPRIAALVDKERQQDGQVSGRLVRSHPRLFGDKIAAFKHLPAHLTRFVVTVNTRPDLGVGDFGPR